MTVRLTSPKLGLLIASEVGKSPLKGILAIFIATRVSSLPIPALVTPIPTPTQTITVFTPTCQNTPLPTGQVLEKTS